MGIPKDVVDLLSKSRYGITFPCASGCQMRFKHRGKDLGGFYSYKQWGGVRKAVKAAISRNQQLRAMHRRRGSSGKVVFRLDGPPTSNTGFTGVSGSRYLDSRREKYYYRYQVRWQDPQGKAHIRSFNLVEPYTPDQQLHAYRTAIQFRKDWEMNLDLFRPERYQLWKSRRLYLESQPELPNDFWHAGEKLKLVG